MDKILVTFIGLVILIVIFALVSHKRSSTKCEGLGGIQIITKSGRLCLKKEAFVELNQPIKGILK